MASRRRFLAGPVVVLIDGVPARRGHPRREAGKFEPLSPRRGLARNSWWASIPPAYSHLGLGVKTAWQRFFWPQGRQPGRLGCGWSGTLEVLI